MRRFLIAAVALGLTASPAGAVDSPYNFANVAFKIRQGMAIAQNYAESCELSAKQCKKLYNDQRRELNQYIRTVAFDPSLDRKIQVQVYKLLKLIVENNEDCTDVASCRRTDGVLVRAIAKLIHDQDPEPPISA